METNVEFTKNKYLHKADLNELHADTIEWLSDLEFCKTELSFLFKLLDKYFLRVRGDEKLNELFILESRVKSFRTEILKDLFEEINNHEKHLASLDENMFTNDEQSIRDEHEKYTLSIKAFMGSVKKVKKYLFDFVEIELKAVIASKKKQNKQMIVLRQPKGLLR
jgi:hypothetical protein